MKKVPWRWKVYKQFFLFFFSFDPTLSRFKKKFLFAFLQKSWIPFGLREKILYNYLVPRFCTVAQSRQSAHHFLQSSELGLPYPLTRRRVCTSPPTPFGSGGDTLTRGKGGGRVTIQTRGQKLWYSKYRFTLWSVPIHLKLCNSKQLTMWGSSV